MTTITADTLIRRVQTIMESKVGEESMMMDIDRGMYYALNPVSARIWALLEQPISVQSVCEKLLQEFEVESSVCEQEVTKFLGQLLDRKVVDILPHKMNAPSGTDL